MPAPGSETLLALATIACSDAVQLGVRQPCKVVVSGLHENGQERFPKRICPSIVEIPQEIGDVSGGLHVEQYHLVRRPRIFVNAWLKKARGPWQ